ncbi:hypothetical protein BCR44DRAFT_1288106 [Catenaria anguillulae PL171]|uniref:Uncharacterized protein n=1 Tax=Catenaria anguillulae PL171 TaxID=765915 RepID=A0A1Y2HA24_9FUNG|nr:hypothetical protein BCR44DRAFT_1288106 [Catenaria anguillulae PL171]
MLGRPSPSPYASSSSARSGSGSGSVGVGLGAGRVPESPFYRRPSAMAPPQGRKSSMPTTLPSAADHAARDQLSSPFSSAAQYQSQVRTSATTPKPSAAAAGAAGFVARPSVPLSNASTTSLHSHATSSRLLSRSSSTSLANGNTLAMSASVPDLRSVVSAQHAQSRTSLHMLSPVPEVRRASTIAAAAVAAPETPTPASRRTTATKADSLGSGTALPPRGDDRTPRPSDRLRSSILGSQQSQQQPTGRPAMASSSNGPPPPTTPFGQRTGSSNLPVHPPLRMSMSMASLPSQSYSTPGTATSTNNGYSHSMNAARESVSRYLDAAADLAQDSATGLISEMSVESLRDENLELKLKLMHYERNMPRDHLDLVNQNIVLTKRVLELQRDLSLANQRSPTHSRTTTSTVANEATSHFRTRTSTASTLTASSTADSDSGSASTSSSTNTSPTSMIRPSADPTSSAFASARRSMTAIGPLSSHHHQHDSTTQEVTPRRDAPRGQVPATPPAVRSHDVFTTPPTVTAHHVRNGITGVPSRMSLVHDPEQVEEDRDEDDQASSRSPLLHRTTVAHAHAHTHANATPRPPSYLSHHRASFDSQASTTSAAAAAASCPLPPSMPMSPASTHSRDARRDSRSSVHSENSSTSSFASQRGLYQRSGTRSPSPHSTSSASTAKTADADTSMADLDRAVRSLSMTESIHLMQPLAGMAHVPDSPEPNRILSPPLAMSAVTPRPPQLKLSATPQDPSMGGRPLRTRLFADHPSVAASTSGQRSSAVADVSIPSYLRSPTLAPLTSPSCASLAFPPTSPAVSTHTSLSEHEEIQVLTQTAADRILGIGTGAGGASSATPATRRSSASTGTVMPAALVTPSVRPSRRPSEATSTGTLSPPTSPTRHTVEYPGTPEAAHVHVRPVRPAADESILSDNTLFMFSGEESDATTLDQMALAEDEDRVIKLTAPPPARAVVRRRSVSGPMIVGRAKAMGTSGRTIESDGRGKAREQAASGIEDQSWCLLRRTRLGMTSDEYLWSGRLTFFCGFWNSCYTCEYFFVPCWFKFSHVWAALGGALT